MKIGVRMNYTVSDILNALTEYSGKQKIPVALEIKIPGRCPSLNQVFALGVKDKIRLKKAEKKKAQEAISSLLKSFPIEGELWTQITSAQNGT